MLTTLLFALEIKSVLKIENTVEELNGFFCMNQIKEP